MIPGMLAMGAQDRLLPPSVPFRFFATAVVMHVAGWAALLVGADTLVGFQGGLGPGLAGLHLMTLGVLAMTALGAAFQLLPVATRHPLGPVWACRLTWWLYAPGVALLSVGMWGQSILPMQAGGTLAVAGLALFAGLVARNLRRVSDLPAVTGHAWIALATLVGLAVLGMALVADVGVGFLPRRGDVAAAHAVLAGYGFMGNLALGFSYVLMPMFALAQGAPDAAGRLTVRLSAAALALTLVGILAGWPVVTSVGGVLGLAAVAVHLRALASVLRARMRKRLEPFFRLVWLAWASLPASMAVGLALAWFDRADLAAPLWGWLLVFGWLLSFVTAILQRIVPFLASMHSGGAAGRPVLMSRLVAERPLLVHAVLHGAALALGAAGIMAANLWLLRAAAGLGLAGALSFAVFAALVLIRTRAHVRALSRPPA